MLQTTVCLANLGSSLPRKGFLRGDVCAGQTNSFNSVNFGSGLLRIGFLKGDVGAVQTGGFYGNSGLVTDRTLHNVCTVSAMRMYSTNFWTDLELV